MLHDDDQDLYFTLPGSHEILLDTLDFVIKLHIFYNFTQS